MEQLQDFFADKTVNNVLDIGTGTGDFVKVLDSVFQGTTDITGVDPGEIWLKEARARFPQENIRFIRMEGEKLEFADHSFDVVSMSKALHHLSNIPASMAEIKRVLKPGGWLIIDENIADGLNEAQENQKMLHHFKSFVDRLNGISHHETWSRGEVIEILQQQGLQVKLSFPHNKSPKPIFDELILNERYQMMEQLLESLTGRPEYDLMAEQLPSFEQRLRKYGFQMATLLLVVGQFEES